MNSTDLPAQGSEPSRCPNCGSYHMTPRTSEDTFTYGAGTDAVELTATVPLEECADCGSLFASESAQMARHEAICRHLGVLTPSEIRELRVNVAGTQSELAKLTGIGKASLARWETGELFQNVANDRFLRLLRYPENVKRLRAIGNDAKPSVGRTSRRTDRKFVALSEADEAIKRAAASTFELSPAT